ncbi:hypothetical protein GTZ85_16125 [Streptomyces sp. SID5474]|nr:hypothetical protein [Streptomyces sp. SID5474]
MQFDDDADLDTSQIEDRRGSAGGGQRRPGLAAGGGAAGLIVAALGPSDGGDSAPADNRALEDSCRRGTDANARDDCRIVGVVDSVQTYWTSEYRRRGASYRSAPTRFFTGDTSTACGGATSAAGPFYCPGDRKVYIDLGFFDDLRTRFGAKGGPFAEA